MSTNTGSNIHVGPNTTATPNPLMQTAQGLAHGELAHNSTLQGTIGQTQMALDEAKYEAPLSAKGQVLVEDVKQVLDSASRLLNERNSDEKLQRLVGSSATAGRETREGVKGSSLPVGKGDLSNFKGPARGFFDNGKSLATFAVRSGQFRELLVELLDLLQGVIGQGKQTLQHQSGQTSGTEIRQDLQHTQVVSEQQKQALFEKFKQLLAQLGSRPEYNTAVDHVFHLFDQIESKANTLKNDPNAANAAANLPTGRYDQVWQEGKAVLEEFSGVGTFDELERKIWILVNLMRADPEARATLLALRQYITEVTRNPNSLQNQQQVEYGKQLFNQTQYLFQGKYKPNFDDIFGQLRLILNNIKNDSVRQDFSTKLHKLGADFAFDEQGRPDLFVIQESLSQMRTILVPVLTKQLANLPIPKIEGSNAKYDFSIDGMILHVGDLLPEFINFRTKTDSRMSVQRLQTQKNTTKIVMEVDKVRALFKDIRFFYRRKRVPRIEDHGIADVDLSQGTGVSVKIVWKLKSRMNQPYLLRLLKVKCSIDRLAITVRNAKHNILDKLATKLFAGTIKKQMANAIVNNIISTLQPISVKLNELFKRKPLTGVMGKANEGMKGALFSGNTGESSLLEKARGAVTSAATQAKEAIHSSSNTSTQPLVGQQTYVQEPLVGQVDRLVIEEPLVATFVERPREPKGWNFEWYSPAPADTLEEVDIIENRTL